VCSLDVDGNGRISATTDGLLKTRYLLGMRGAALTAGAIGFEATRSSPSDIEAHLASSCIQPGWVGKGSGQLNDTAMTVGANLVSGTNFDCTSNGPNIAQQDCSTGRDANPALNNVSNGAVGFSFTKIANNGSELPATAALGNGANDWACTYDNVTGLMWEVKTTSGRRSQAHTYSWFSSFDANNAGSGGAFNDGVCGDSPYCDTEGYVLRTNSFGLCGHTDWRMPHVKELFGIVNADRFGPSIDTDYFPNTPAAAFWSGTPSALDVLNAWRVNFFEHGSTFDPRRTVPLRVRLVRSGR
jgi:hypothetical protein